MVYSAQAFIHNETDERLSLLGSSVDGRWSWPAPGAIDPGTVGVLRTLAGGPVTGTGGSATYRAGDDATHLVDLSWDNPFVGSNSFRIDPDPSHFGFWSASSGNHPVVHFFVRKSGSFMTSFAPGHDGFQFANQWPDPTPYSLPPLRGSFLDVELGNAADGLCGGMVYAALDYYLAGRLIPTHTSPPANDQDPLFVELVDRIFDSFTVDNVSLLMKLCDPLYPDSNDNALSALDLAEGRAAVMALQEWPLIRGEIDAGRPSPVMVQTVKSLWPFDLGQNHQVLAYGYTASGHDVTLHVYDPNEPHDNGIYLRFNDGDTTQRIVVEHNLGLHDKDDGHLAPVYCFFRPDYTPKAPRIETPRRPSDSEIAHRGVYVTVADPVTVGGEVLDRGRITLDVPPDCGSQDFDYEVRAQQQSVTLTAHPHGYFDPVLAWQVASEWVEAGLGQTLTLHSVDATDDDSRVDAAGEGWTGKVGPVTVHTTVSDSEATLTIENVMGAPNCSLPITARCHERDEPYGTVFDRTWTYVLTLVGREQTVIGYAEAAGGCVRNYVQRHEDGPPDARAIGAMMRAQLRRPPDPLWDPDPTQLEIRASLGLEDSLREELQTKLVRPAWTLGEHAVHIHDSGVGGSRHWEVEEGPGHLEVGVEHETPDDFSQS